MPELADELGDRQSQDPLYRLRHSLAHVMAQAVLEMRPGSTRGFGPPIDTGFYYDFVLSSPLTPEDLPEIEKRMRAILARDVAFVREELPLEQAFQRLQEMGEPYKAEYARELAAKHDLASLSFYVSGAFVDMCEGPHVASTREIPNGSFKLRSIAGAYWRGDERQQMMTRIYAWAYRDKQELEEAVRRHEEGLKRDHKKLGAQLDLFVIDPEVGKGLPLWLPHGTVIRDELEKLAKEEEFQAGYLRVATPHVTRQELYLHSGHLPYYRNVMYPPMRLEERSEEGGGQVTSEVYYLKPMNCPHHHRIFAARMRSYRELPLRLAEYGDVYRFEEHGALSGLLRVRGMSMNDAHIYCAEEQIQDEFLAVMRLHEKYFQLLGIEGFYLRLSLWNPDDPKGKEKYVDNPEAWRRTEQLVRRAMQESGLPFVEATGEAAFYGPKIDVQLSTVTGREETVSTNQLDFAQPAADRMNLTYIGADGKPHHPYVIHRAPLSTHERMVAFLIEHFGGAFPTWLAPVQVRLLPISEKHVAYARKLEAELRKHFVRAEVDDADETIRKKVREAVTRKIPNLLILGEREQADGAVTVRRYGEERQEQMPFGAFLDVILREIRDRSMRRKPGL